MTHLVHSQFSPLRKNLQGPIHTIEYMALHCWRPAINIHKYTHFVKITIQQILCRQVSKGFIYCQLWLCPWPQRCREGPRRKKEHSVHFSGHQGYAIGFTVMAAAWSLALGAMWLNWKILMVVGHTDFIGTWVIFAPTWIRKSTMFNEKKFLESVVHIQGPHTAVCVGLCTIAVLRAGSRNGYLVECWILPSATKYSDVLVPFQLPPVKRLFMAPPKWLQQFSDSLH